MATGSGCDNCRGFHNGLPEPLCNCDCHFLKKAIREGAPKG